jgi:hypothetical protein
MDIFYFNMCCWCEQNHILIVMGGRVSSPCSSRQLLFHPESSLKKYYIDYMGVHLLDSLSS